MSAEHPAIGNICIRCAMDTRYFTLMPFGDALRTALAAEPMRSEVDSQTDVPMSRHVTKDFRELWELGRYDEKRPDSFGF